MKPSASTNSSPINCAKRSATTATRTTRNGIFRTEARPTAARVRHVVAYEPGSLPRAHLEVSRMLNRARTLKIVPAAVSDSVREGRLALGASTELSRLGDSENGEAVAITALDREDAENAWSPDIVKLDAEGEERAIVEGGRAFFTRHSPLVESSS